MFFLKSHAENKVGRLVPDLFMFFKKALYESKATGQHLWTKAGITLSI